MLKKTLLLDASYQVQSFIDFKRAIKHLIKDPIKVEVLANWDEIIPHGNGSVILPAILRLNYTIKRSYFNPMFSRKSLIKRDQSTCQYCGKQLALANLTIDHVVPKALGGGTSYLNCVVACRNCNTKKGSLLLEQVGMKLLNKPTHPSYAIIKEPLPRQTFWHQEWDNYLI